MIRGLSKLAVRNTLRRGKKSWITVIGVFIGIAAVVSLVSLGQGLEGAITQEFEDLGANNIFVSGDITDEDLDLVRNIRGVDEAGGYYSSSEPVKFNGETGFVNVYGVELDKVDMIFSGQGWEALDGQLRTTDKTSALLGPSFEENFDSKPRIRSQLGLEGQNFRVAGFISAGDPSAQNSIIIGLERAREVYEIEDEELSSIVVKIQPGFTQKEVQENIMESLRRDRGVEEGEEDFSTNTPQDILESLTSILGVVQGIVVGLASIALLVGGIGIMNTMYMSINERTQEIGVLKAIGASKRQIRALFLIESSLIGLIGGIIGVLIGIGISEIAVFVASNTDAVNIARGYDIPLILGALTFSTVLGLISGYLPARKASNLEPADALRYE
ncbi:MAG: ABC transporter permease [Candidatus Nanohaloarchaea archaeon]